MKKRVVLIVILLFCGQLVVKDQTATATVPGPSRDSERVAKPISNTAAAFAESQPVITFPAPAKLTVPLATPDLLRAGRTVEPGTYPANIKHDPDAAIAERTLTAMPTPSLAFDGLSNFDNINAYSAVVIPPDTIGDVGPNHYVQAVNLLVRVFDKSGTAVTAPFKLSQLFAPLGTACSSRNDGDPIVLYDPLADRWLISQYCTNFPPFRQMIAISKTGDPTGAYFLYEFVMPNIKLNDFPKFGVWPDGYYMSTEEFTGSDFTGTGAFAFDRAKMLAGDPSAAFIYFSRPSATTARLGNLLPADLDGLCPPTAGSPNVFAGYTATEYGDSQDAIRLFDFHADFADPASSTFTERPESPLAVAAFDPTSPDGRTDITQPAPGEKLDANSDRLNYRAAYRNFGSSESLVLNQTVRLATDPYRAGVRVYQMRRTNGTFAVTEQSTIGDNVSSRWIGSAAEDNQGNLAVGYNHVTDAKQPSIFYTGKLATEPPGTFRDEATLMTGTGVQKAFGWRWGDYSGMSVDPADDCTFWMTGEYFTLASEQFSDFTWLTRIGKFKFPECTAAPRAAITGTVTNSSNGQPIANASVTAAAYSRSTATSGSYGSLTVIPGSYTITAAASGFRPRSFTVSPAGGQTVTQNFSLEPIPVLQNAGLSVSAESCGSNGAPDPGETVSINLSLQNTGSMDTQNLIAELLPGSGITVPNRFQTYGAMTAGGPAVTRTFTFTVDPNVVCGSRLTLTFHLQDGLSDLGNLTIPLQTGSAKVALKENFDRTQLGRLPPRWTRFTSDANGLPDWPRNWTVSSARSQTAAKSTFSPDINQRGIGEMTSPVFRITTAAGRVTFRNWYDFETTFLRNRLYDGAVLEIRIGGGEWQDILTAGGVFESGGYDGLIDACCQNPLQGRPGWSGKSGLNETSEFITTAVRLPAAAAGQTVQLRWLVGTDIGGLREGQYIDDLLVTDGYTCGCSSQGQP
ncbi:hypothetical protein BH10ACI3_BH10ACI3_11490 [soil metagenome]